MLDQCVKSEDASNVEHPEPVRESTATTAMPLPMKRGSIAVVGSAEVGRVVVEVDDGEDEDEDVVEDVVEEG